MTAPYVWLNKWTFKVTHPISGRSQTVTFPGVDRLSRERRDNLVAWQVEETMAELAGPETQVRAKPFDRNDQHALSETLDGIMATKRRLAETGNRRYL